MVQSLQKTRTHQGDLLENTWQTSRLEPSHRQNDTESRGNLVSDEDNSAPSELSPFNKEQLELLQ